MKKFNKTSVTTLISAAVISSFTANVNAETTNPYAMNELAQGYMQQPTAAKTAAPATKTAPVATVKPVVAPATKTSGTCAEGKCGDMMKPAAAAVTAPAKTEEGKCGEGMCGGMMENGKMKAGMEMMCGAMMKGKEGSCGDMAGKPAAVAAPAVSATPVAPATTPTHTPAPVKAVEMACGAMMKGKEGSCGDMVKEPAIVAPTPAPVVATVPAAAPAKPASAPVATAPAKPAAPARATSNKVVEGQCAAVKEETHDATKVVGDGKAKPWGNRKKVVNP